MLDNDFTLDYDACRRLLLERLQEPAPGRIQLLTGPRQVGKTTLLLDLTKHLGEAAQYVAGDDPQAGLPGFWERVWAGAETRARAAQPFSFLMRFSTLRTGVSGSRDNMIVSGVCKFRCIS